MRRFFPHVSIVLASAIGAMLSICTMPLRGQVELHPSIGLQTMWFNGDVPVAQPISPGVARELPLGGGMLSNNNGVRLQLEVLPSPEGLLRFPVSFEYFDMSGKTTFSFSVPSDVRKKRLLFTHTASVISIGAGVTANFFKLPSLYFGAEGKFNYIPSSTLTSRIYFVDNDETAENGLRVTHPNPESQSRIGIYMKVGTQLDFFEPFLLDFSLGYGALNVIAKETDPANQRNLLIVDSDRRDPEQTVGYIGIGFSLVWKM